MEDTDILEHTATAYEHDEVQTRPFVLPPSRRGGRRLLAMLRGLIPSGRQQRHLRARQAVPAGQKFELPLDMLARKHPDLYLRIMTGIG
jgi:hypothetical protein